MNEAKHTPGPWTFSVQEQLGEVRFYVAQAEGAPFTASYSDVSTLIAQTVSGERVRTQEANARLISAAPEMLEALKWYENQAKEMGKAAIHSDSKRMLELMQEIAVDYGKLAGAAIAKATGRADSADGEQKGTP